MKYLLNAAHYVAYFASIYLKPLEKSHMKSGPSDMLLGWNINWTRSNRKPSKKSILKAGPSNRLLRWTIYLTESNRWQPNMFKTDLRKNHMKSSLSNMVTTGRYLLNPVQQETFEKILMESGPPETTLICRIYETRFISRQSMF